MTEADHAVNAFLGHELPRLWPEAAWLSEESVDDLSRLAADRVIIVDPIDGTRGFARGDSHWAIAIALVERGRPIVGIVHAPALGETYLAVTGQGATLNGSPLHLPEQSSLWPRMLITCPTNVAKALRATGLDFTFQPKIASLALRIVKVASGVYDAGFASSSAHDWDLAAADLVLQEAGGILAGLDGAPLIYNRPDPSHGALTATPLHLQAPFRAAIGLTPFGKTSA